MTTLDPDALIAGEIEALPDADLLSDIKQLIISAEAERPRSQQTALGPSQAGHECERRLAYSINASVNAGKLTRESKGANSFSDPMAAIIGTASHSWMEEAVIADNRRLGRYRWIPEHKVEVREGLSGTCDLYDLDTASVLDWKFPGSTRYEHYAKHGPSNTYRGQAHLYGRGYKRLGFPVKYVGNIYISRAGSLRKIHLWREPYNDALVDEILDRYDRVGHQMEMLRVDEFPDNFKQIPVTPDSDCIFCPWFSVNPEGPFSCGKQ